MKKLVIFALVFSTSAVVFAQKKADPKDMDKKPPMMMDDKDMPMMHDMMMMDDKASKKGRKGEKGMKGGMMMELSPSDEAMMKKQMMDRGMSNPDATRMIQLRKEMFMIMKKYMDKPMPPADKDPKMMDKTPPPAPKKP